MPHVPRDACSWHGHPCRRQPHVPPLRDASQPWREKPLCLSALVFFFLLFSELGISRCGWGREGRSKDEKDCIPEEHPKSWLPCAQAVPHPKGAVGCRESTSGFPAPTHRLHPSLPCPASPPLSPRSRNWLSKVQQVWVQPDEAFGAAKHPIMMPWGGTTLRQVGGAFVGFWDGGVELSPAPTPAAGPTVGQCKPNCSQSPLLPNGFSLVVYLRLFLAMDHVHSQDSHEQICQGSCAQGSRCPPRAPQRCVSVWCPSFLGRPSLAGRNLFCISNFLW